MPLVAMIMLAAGLVWGAIYARRGSLVVGGAALIAISYVLGYNFWHQHVGPLPLTLDRIVLVGLLGTFAVQWRCGALTPKPLCGADWMLFLLLGIVAMSSVTAGEPLVRAPEPFSANWRLVMSFVVPMLLYWMMRDARVTEGNWKFALAIFALLGFYLALTGLAEVAGLWALVFPRFISDPTLGIHFGRARGPDLNSASLGIYLTVCLWAAWFLRGAVRRHWQLALLAAVPLMSVGILATYTRSTWIGLVASAALIAFIQLPRHLRVPLLAAGALVGVLLLAVSWSSVVGLQREGTASESGHSVDQRTSFAYVSWQMFKDHPFLGVGFGRFFDCKLPYLSDRSQPFELESIRGLHHHNTLLSLLTETGLAGIAAFLGLLLAWARSGWSLARDTGLPYWKRSQGAFLLAVLATYFSSALFHDLTLLPAQEWLLFLVAGVTMSVRLGTLPTAASAGAATSYSPSGQLSAATL